jgi:hypothetical protein
MVFQPWMLLLGDKLMRLAATRWTAESLAIRGMCLLWLPLFITTFQFSFLQHSGFSFTSSTRLPPIPAASAVSHTQLQKTLPQALFLTFK